MTIQEYNDIYKNSITKSMQIESSGGVTITNTNICSEQMSLEEALCSEENLIIGSCESACFKIRIADMNHNFEGETLTVYQMIMVDEGGDLLLESGDSDYILLENGDRISLEMVGVPVPYGKFKVLSDKPTNDRRWRDLTCYDAMYDILNADVAEWYNSLTFPMTIKNFRDRFFNYLGITQDTVTLVNDNFETQGGFSVSGALSGKDVITSICELNGVFGHISRDGLFEYISLPSANSLALDWYIDGTGAYEDYLVQKITGIVARSSEDDVGTTVGTDTNLYVVEDNPLIYGSEGTASLTTALTNLLNNVKDINYRPFNVDTYGNPMLPLGTNLTITTRNQTINSFLMTRVLSGIQSLKDSISAKGEKYRPTEVNSLRSETKRTKGIIHELINDVDELRSTIIDLDNQTSSEIQQLSDEIVLKVDASGNIVKVALSASADEGSNFAINADNITFTAGSVLRFDANNIVINSTYFKVDQYGNLECTSGKIGGWTISSNSLKKTYSNLSNTAEYETALVASNNSSRIYSQTSYTSAGFKVKLNIEDGLLDIINTAGSSMDANTPIVSFGYTLAGTASTPTSAAGIIHVYDTKYINGDDSIPYTVTTNYGFEVRKNGTGFASINDNGVCLYYLGNNYGKVLAVDNTSDHKIVATNTTITEVEYVHGVTSNIQTQLNGKQATITGGATTIVSDNLTASKALVSNANGKVVVSSVTATELGYLSGVTSNVQTQLDSKISAANGAISTVVNSNLTANRALVSNASGKIAVSSVTSTELGYLSGVTSNVQTQLNGKQSTISGGATTITSSNLTTNRALVSNSSGKVATSSVTATELGYVSGVTSNIQGQIDVLSHSIHPHIYGVKWDWANSNSSALNRTDTSQYFANPSPALSNGTGSSPFDLLYPWCDMQVVEDSQAGTLVSIPKFWYKMTNSNGLYTLQIADAPVEGFQVSPAHMDRGDGKGERDVVYVGRYHCNTSYKSQTGYTPKGSITRSTARTNIHNLGSTIWQYDYLTMWTIRILYLVEFADFNSQEKIGYGCSPSGALFTMGYTDSMGYHTGTDATARTTYGGTQYRHIEGLWDNVLDYVDGVYFNSSSTYIIKNPSSFGESGGTSIGTKIGANGSTSNNGVVSAYSIASASGLVGLPFATAKTTNAAFNIYSCDYVAGRSTGVTLLSGGNYAKSKQCGLFYENGWNDASFTTADVGCRLMKLP